MFKNLLIKDVANAFKKLTLSSVSTPPRCTSTLHNKYSTTQTDNPTTAQTNSVINTHTTTQTDSVTATHTNTQTTEPIYRLLKNIPDGLSAKESWLESFKTDRKRGLIQLHPDVFAVFPRLDVIWSNVQWQKKYRTIDYRVVRNRAEMPGGGRKPWPQKGTGRARQGSIRSPLFKGGGKCFGPRGPRSFFFMLPFQQRLLGLTSSLSVKYHQGLLHIVEDLDLPSNKPEDLESIVEERGWGLSVLFVDNTDTMPHNISMACHHIEQYNLMPLYGLNVYSMLKHETLVITMSALEELEDKLLMHTNSVLPGNRKFEKTRGDVKWHRTVPQTVQ